jgi:PST family polysaccharide transporter
MALLLTTIKPRYRPGWNRNYAREVLVYSLPLAAATIVEFTLGNVDYIVVGRMLGALSLGYYTLAYNISGWPVSVFGLMINEVALPAFARAQDDARGLPRRVAGAFALTAAVAFPVSAMCLALSQPLVTAVYGPRWAAASAALAVLGLFGSMRIILTLVSNVLAALGDSKAVLTLQLVWIAALIPALVFGVSHHGIIGAAVAQEVISVVIVLPLACWFIYRAGGGPPGALVVASSFPAAAAALAGGAAWGAAKFVPNPLLQVLVGGVVGMGIYVLIVGRWLRRLLAEARGHWNDTTADGSDTADIAAPAGQPIGQHRVDKRHGKKSARSGFGGAP